MVVYVANKVSGDCTRPYYRGARGVKHFKQFGYVEKAQIAFTVVNRGSEKVVNG